MPKFATVEDYLAAVPPDRLERLNDLRSLIRSTAPAAVEQILYDMPAYKLEARFFVSFGWFKAHDSLFPASRAVLEALPEAGRFARGRGTFQFPVRDPLPMDLIGRIIEARMTELAEEAGTDATADATGGS